MSDDLAKLIPSTIYVPAEHLKLDDEGRRLLKDRFESRARQARLLSWVFLTLIFVALASGGAIYWLAPQLASGEEAQRQKGILDVHKENLKKNKEQIQEVSQEIELLFQAVNKSLQRTYKWAGITPPQHNDIASIGQNQMIAVGFDGTIVRSEDGGKTWNAVASGTNNFLGGVHFATPKPPSPWAMAA